MRLIDADALKKKIMRKLCPRPQDFLIPEEEAIIDCIDDAPTAEQPEIIHCRECKHYYFADNRIPQEQRYTCDLDGDEWKPDDYCSYGERREVSE